MNVYSTIPEMSNRRIDSFARDAVYAEFRPRDARALDYDKFQDRKPSEKPREPPAGIDALLVLAE
jgi:hypothetical protein